MIAFLVSIAAQHFFKFHPTSTCIVVDLTEEEPVTQEGFVQRYKRYLLGEDAQIMRRFLKLKMPFVRAPLQEKPVLLLTELQLNQMSARFDKAYHGIVDDEQTEQSELPIEHFVKSQEERETVVQDRKTDNSYSFTQAAANNDDFFGGNGIGSEVLLTPKKPEKRTTRQDQRSSPAKRPRAEVEKFTPDGWKKFNYKSKPHRY